MGALLGSAAEAAEARRRAKKTDGGGDSAQAAGKAEVDAAIAGALGEITRVLGPAATPEWIKADEERKAVNDAKKAEKKEKDEAIKKVSMKPLGAGEGEFSEVLAGLAEPPPGAPGTLHGGDSGAPVPPLPLAGDGWVAFLLIWIHLDMAAAAIYYGNRVAKDHADHSAADDGQAPVHRRRLARPVARRTPAAPPLASHRSRPVVQDEGPLHNFQRAFLQRVLANSLETVQIEKSAERAPPHLRELPSQNLGAVLALEGEGLHFFDEGVAVRAGKRRPTADADLLTFR